MFLSQPTQTPFQYVSLAGPTADAIVAVATFGFSEPTRPGSYLRKTNHSLHCETGASELHAEKTQGDKRKTPDELPRHIGRKNAPAEIRLMQPALITNSGVIENRL